MTDEEIDKRVDGFVEENGHLIKEFACIYTQLLLSVKQFFDEEMEDS